MARTLHAYLDPARLPSRQDLQAALKRLGFKLTLDEAYVAGESTGYLPCTLDGEDAGVYLRQEPSSRPGLRSHLMALRWGGDAREHACALMWAAALAADCDAEIQDPDSGALLPGDRLQAQARALVEALF